MHKQFDCKIAKKTGLGKPLPWKGNNSKNTSTDRKLYKRNPLLW